MSRTRPSDAPPLVRSSRLLVALLATGAVMSALALTGCSSAREPVRDARDAIGTFVSVTAYPRDTASDDSVAGALDAAYDALAAAEAELDAHNPDSAIAGINGVPDPGIAALPQRAETILDTICALEVREYFSPQLWAVADAWAFEDGGRVPTTEQLAAALLDPRYDFGGAAKGLALDEAAAALRDSRAVDAALITAGSTTVTLGSKPDGEPWRIGVEHPREPGEAIATIESPGELTVSTSGDYQRFFERDGVRYHHILDPATGLPARGLQSLTVIGEIPGLDSDILSTALFVAGADTAISYAEEHGLGLVLVDDEGRIQIVSGPENASWKIIGS
ncbi:MAG: FAD:protein FMN transferase [Coriobacteriia bacterium]|nr:FAD:protein FMN transferase [Coriobacteriia bacterium]